MPYFPLQKIIKILKLA